MKRGKPHPVIDRHAVCEAYGWTIEEFERQPLKETSELIVVQNAIASKRKQELRRQRRKKGKGSVRRRK